MRTSNNLLIFNPAYLIFGFAVLLASVYVIVNAARFPAEAFKGSGMGKTSWIVLQAVFMLFCGIGALIMVFVWFLMKKPVVSAHARTYGYGRTYLPPPGAMPPGSFPRQPGYGNVPPGGYGDAPPGSKFAQYGNPPPPEQYPQYPPPGSAPPPSDAPPSWGAPPPPPPGPARE